MQEKIDELLLEMKDTSELMLDLAYSALLYRDKDIAEAVFELEEDVDAMHYRLQRCAVEGVLSDKDVEKALVLIRLAACIETVADSALEMADVVLRGIPPHPIYELSVSESDIILVRKAVAAGSPMVGKTLGELRLATRTGMWLLAIKRKNRWIFGPDEHTRIQKNDLLYARGPIEGKQEFVELAEGARELPE
jgi:uncharacterized protein with PhoU and TrkA domain